MSRREMRLERADYPPPPPSKCAKVLYYTWKLCSVVFSHFVMISLVVAYCILGAVTFERLEAQHEREVKMNISQIRGNTTHSIWTMTNKVPYLNQTNWTAEVVDMLKDFENAILLEMKVRGWDGNESTEHIQWTFTGALFYSIIVITTIGYGHIAPKTQTGKVVTIFYAILGIPLMLLCLSNIGDVMASSFRFLYWRVCCYVCTRPPKQSRRHTRRSHRAGSVRRRRPLERSYSDNDFRYRDSGYNSARARRARPAPAYAPAPASVSASAPGPARTRSHPPAYARPYAPGWREYEEDRSPARNDDRDPYEDDEEDFPKISLPLQDLQAALRDLDNYQPRSSKPELRSKSLPRPSKTKPEFGPKRDYEDARHFDIEDDREMYEMHDLFDVDYANYRERKALEERDKKRRERDDYRLRDRGYDPEDDDFEFDIPRTRRSGNDRRYDRSRSEYYERDFEEFPGERRGRGRGRRAKSAVYESERRYDEWDDERDVERGRRRLRRLHTVDDTPHARAPQRYTPSPERDDWSDEPPPIRRGRSAAWGSRQSDIYAVQGPAKEEIKPVPIWLCVFLVASYIVSGTFLFKRWEGWAYLDAAYFCFITLTTIGFGDFVPAQGQSGEAADAVHSIALCSLYLLFGIALLAMSFNLVQEEVRANVAAVATRLGIIKPRDHAEE
ncbi:uncharacterized protein LOC112044115 [Bicyclus anynana]|uniref:Uncharacterized protein LOC112044115 n=1 Tax=Bicyclus anynana TaxID=110368 RepID=A0ABM3LPH6_BICAN|nr:uncharacterized protein LOC112044115 [Bicyclus anynana]